MKERVTTLVLMWGDTRVFYKESMFEALKQLWNSMTPVERQEKVAALKRVAMYKSFCEARGYIKFDPVKLEVKILQMAPEVKKLKEALDEAEVQGVKYLNRAGKIKKWKQIISPRA